MNNNRYLPNSDILHTRLPKYNVPGTELPGVQNQCLEGGGCSAARVGAGPLPPGGPWGPTPHLPGPAPALPPPGSPLGYPPPPTSFYPHCLCPSLGSLVLPHGLSPKETLRSLPVDWAWGSCALTLIWPSVPSTEAGGLIARASQKGIRRMLLALQGLGGPVSTVANTRDQQTMGHVQPAACSCLVQELRMVFMFLKS